MVAAQLQRQKFGFSSKSLLRVRRLATHLCPKFYSSRPGLRHSILLPLTEMPAGMHCVGVRLPRFLTQATCCYK